VDAELVAFLQFVFPYPNPHAVVVRCPLYVGGLESLFLQCLDCTFALFLCHCSFGLVLDNFSARDLLCLTSSASCILESSTTMLKMSLLFMVVDLVVCRARTIVVRLLVVSRIFGGGGTGCDGDGQDDGGGHDVSQTFHCSWGLEFLDLNCRKLGCAIASSMVVHRGVLISVPSVICRQLSSGAYLCRSNPCT